VALFSRPGLFAPRFFAAAAMLVAAAPALAQGRIQVHATPIPYFDYGNHELRRFGKLEFRGGLQLTSPTKSFGGLSSLIMERDGSHFLSATDNGRWLRGRITYSGAAPSGIADAEMAPMLGPDGKRLAARGWWVTESLAKDDAGNFYVGIERVHRVVKFDFGKDGFRARGIPIAVPPEFKSMPLNQSLEALAVAPQSHPLAGALIVISESDLDAAGNIKSWLLGGPSPGTFTVKRSDDFDVTDCALLPDGDLLILERRFSWLRGAAVRIRRIAAAAVRPGAIVDGEQLLYADAKQQVDNFEGLGIHRTAKGETVLTLISDDNFSPLQRTLLMQFTLPQ
jgi:hypothetical protein